MLESEKINADDYVFTNSNGQKRDRHIIDAILRSLTEKSLDTRLNMSNLVKSYGAHKGGFVIPSTVVYLPFTEKCLHKGDIIKIIKV